MDLGALICVRRKPDCSACPVAQDCQANLRGLTSELPSRRPKTKVENIGMTMVMLHDDQDRLLFERRPPSGIWGGLWCLPAAENVEDLQATLGVNFSQTQELTRFEHRLSHRLITIRALSATVERPTSVRSADHQRWCDLEQQSRLGLPKPVATLLQRLKAGEFD